MGIVINVQAKMWNNVKCCRAEVYVCRAGDENDENDDNENMTLLSHNHSGRIHKSEVKKDVQRTFGCRVCICIAYVLTNIHIHEPNVELRQVGL